MCHLALALQVCNIYMWIDLFYHALSTPGFTCSKLTLETLEQGVKYVQS